MLAVRRLANISRCIHPFSSYQFRYKSRKANDEESKSQKTTSINEELLEFERKDAKIARNLSQNKKYPSNDDRKARQQQQQQAIARETSSFNVDGHEKTEELLRNFNLRDVNRRKKSVEELSRLNLNKSFGSIDKNSKRDGERKDSIPKKTSRPHVILDTESDEVKILTRQVADSLTPTSSPNESSNIEQELLDVLRGHRVVSKSARRMEKKTDVSVEKSSQKQVDRTGTPQTRTVDEEKSTEAFSSLLRDIKLKPTRGTTKSTAEEEFIRDAVRGSEVRPRFSDEREPKRDMTGSRKPMRDTRRRQEFMKPHQLWSGEPLGIFTSKDASDPSLTVSPIWDKYEQDELARVSSIPPRNAFEEMIEWTKNGILWKFPVDNEQDIGPEADIPFYDHVLLERHLQDFPKSPLIRQFMELVCVGLGRNPYWTAEQKLEHINWFRTFFNEKMNVLNETVHTGEIRTSAPPPAPKPVSTYKPKPAPAPAPPKVAPVVPPAASAATTGKTPTASKK